MSTPRINPAFANLFVAERTNIYRDCIQGLANEPITVQALLHRAEKLLQNEAGFAGLGAITQAEIVERLHANRPRICIIQGSADHPAHLYDHEHMLRAAARIWQNGGVPFTFGVPVICDGTAQNNIGQSYSLASRNHTAAAVNINFEGHGYHAAYVLSGCDKSPTGILSGLAAADRARRNPERGNAPVWAIFVPSHVLRGGVIPPNTLQALQQLRNAAQAAGETALAHDIDENCHYILQCSSDEAFLGILNRASNLKLITPEAAEQLLKELAAATCDDKGGICAFNGTGNSSRTLVSALGFVPRESELLLDEAPSEVVSRNVDYLFNMINKPEYAVCDLLEHNYANAVRIHCATGSSTNLMLHMPCVMRHAGFDVTLQDYERVRLSHAIPDVFAHSLTEGRDTYTLAQQAHEGLNNGMESLFKVLTDLGVPMNLAAPTVMGKTWGERVAAMQVAVSPALPQERSVIRIKPIRDISGTDILRGNFLSTCTLKVAGMSSEQYRHFNERVFVVRYFENETDCNRELQSPDLINLLAQMPCLTDELCARLLQINGGEPGTVQELITRGTIAFALVIAGQGPKAFGMPEMFAPSQYLRHHGVLEKTSILMTDGRYSGVTKGACIGHITPEAFEGGAVGTLENGDLLWMSLTERTLNVIDSARFLSEGKVHIAYAPSEAKQALAKKRIAAMEHRQEQVAACNLMEHVTDAEKGVVPEGVNKRARIKLSTI